MYVHGYEAREHNGPRSLASPTFSQDYFYRDVHCSLFTVKAIYVRSLMYESIWNCNREKRDEKKEGGGKGREREDLVDFQPSHPNRHIFLLFLK